MMDIRKQMIARLVFSTSLSQRGAGKEVDYFLNLPVGEEKLCCSRKSEDPASMYYCVLCDGKGTIPPKTLKQLIEEAQNG